MTSFDPQQISDHLGAPASRLEDQHAWMFEVVGETSILSLCVFQADMNVSIEVFDRAGGQPLVSLRLDYCESVDVRQQAAGPAMTITQSVHCMECSARRERRFFVTVQPKLRIWNEG